jgi:predicted metal-dependent hydrolase
MRQKGGRRLSKPTVIFWKEVHEVADKVSKHFGLKYNTIVPETRKLARCYGECRSTPKGMNIFVRVHQLKNPRRPLAASTILRTLAHEMAHLKHWGHGPAHRAFTREIVEYIKELEYMP